MNQDEDGIDDLGHDRPLDPSIMAAIDSVEPEVAGSTFWADLDHRLDEVDRERSQDAHHGRVDAVAADRGSDPFAVADDPVINIDRSTVGSDRPNTRDGRGRFLAAAAAIAVIVAGLAWLVVQGQGTPTDPAGAGLPEPSTLIAEDMTTKVEGEAEPGAWLIWRAGYIEDQVTFPADGSYEFVVVAKGRFIDGGELGPDLELLIDSVTVGATQPVQLDAFVEYRFVGQVEAGTRAIAVSNAELSTPTRPTSQEGVSPLLIVDRVTISPVAD